MKILSAYYNYVKDPKETIREMLAQRYFGAAVGGYLAAALSFLVFFEIGSSLNAWPFVIKLGVLFLAALTGGYIAASLSGLFLDITGKKGGSSGLFIILGLSGYVNSLLIVFALCATALPWLWPLAAPAVLLVWILQIIFAVKGTSRAYDISAGKAFGTLFFSAVPVAAVGFLGLAFFIWILSALFN